MPSWSEVAVAVNHVEVVRFDLVMAYAVSCVFQRMWLNMPTACSVNVSKAQMVSNGMTCRFSAGAVSTSSETVQLALQPLASVPVTE